MKADTSTLLLVVGSLFAVAPATPVAARAQQGEKNAAGLTADEITLYARVIQMSDRRALDIATAREAIASHAAAVRAASSLAVAQLAPTNRDAALPLLRELVENADTAVAANAAFGLGLACDTASIARLAATVRRGGAPGIAAAWSLGEVGAPASATIAALIPASTAPRVRARLLIAASKIRPVDVALVAPYLKDQNAFVQWAAAAAIARQRAPGGVRALLHVVRPSADTRIEIARGLDAAAAGDSLRQQALDLIARLVLDDYAQVRIAALRSAASYGPIARVPIIRAMEDPDPNVRLAAIQAAGPVFGHDSTEWEALWDRDTSFVFKRSVLASAMQSGVTLPVLERWRVHSDWRYRAGAIFAWRSPQDTAAAKLACLLASHDADGRVRAASYEVLAGLDPTRTDSVVQHLLAGAAKDPDRYAREGLPWYRPLPTAADSAAHARPLAWYESVVRAVVVPSLTGIGRGATITTDRGTIRLAFLGTQAPITVHNFMVLAHRGYYNGLRFHRIVPGFVAQDGDPRGDGNGGPGYAIRDELNRESYTRGAVGMALSGPDTGGSQYFLTLSPQPHLNGHYTVFARVVTGLAVMDRLVQGDRITSIIVQ